MAIEQPYWGDGSYWGDGDYWTSIVGSSVEHVTEYETIFPHYLSLRLNYTATVTPGEVEAFVIHSARLRTREGPQRADSHYTFVDRVTPSERVALRLEHTGSEFIVSHMQIIAQPKRKQQHG